MVAFYLKSYTNSRSEGSLLVDSSWLVFVTFAAAPCCLETVFFTFSLKKHNSYLKSEIFVLTKLNIFQNLIYTPKRQEVRSEISKCSKNARPDQQSWIYTTIHEKNEHRNSEAWFPNYGFLTNKENVQGFYLEFPCRHSRRQSVGPYFVPPRLTKSVHHNFLRNVLPELL